MSDVPSRRVLSGPSTDDDLCLEWRCDRLDNFRSKEEPEKRCADLRCGSCDDAAVATEDASSLSDLNDVRFSKGSGPRSGASFVL